jgi:hypothetical protein
MRISLTKIGSEIQERIDNLGLSRIKNYDKNIVGFKETECEDVE